jgi:glycogen debranching enzyme
VEIRPESLTRYYELPEGTLREIVLPSLDQPGALISYDSSIDSPLELIVTFRSDLRWMWPYDERAIGDLYYGYDEKLQALHIKDAAGDLYTIIGADQTPLQTFTGQFDDINWKVQKFSGDSTHLNQVYHGCRYRLSAENHFNMIVAVAGSNEGMKNTVEAYHSVLFDPKSEYKKAVQFYSGLLQRVTTLQTPNEQLNRFWKWAIVGTERFFVETPGVGKGLLAGYSTTARGWKGGHKISGRPGYAWYFGRDSEWCGFAIDDYGHFGLVREQLKFLRQYQSLSGKIFHEISTSGVVHYDASDATPLYIILAAHYFRASGDIDFIRQNWPSIKNALAFLYSTDTDGDLLIENTNVGHGWVEGGKLWGAHTTLYLAALWAQTLKDAAYMASHLNLPDEENKYHTDAQKVIKIINEEFWNETTGFFNYGKMKDGTYNEERTVLPAVAMYYRLLDPDKVNRMLDEFAGNGFSPDWGVRIVSSESPLFVPYGYHYGSVWPLFTGWTALAEYQYGNAVQGFTHMMNNIGIKNYWSLGFVEEVMNGAVYKPSGVCPHQCWSETNILHPGINGMIGWQPDAPQGLAVLEPQFPLGWKKVEVKNLRIGKSRVNFIMERLNHETIYSFSISDGPPVKIDFIPHFALGMKPLSVFLNGQAINFAENSSSEEVKSAIRLNLSEKIFLKIEHQGGIGAVPHIPRPLPEDSAKGYKIIREDLSGAKYSLWVEGKSGGELDLEVVMFGQDFSDLIGAELVHQTPNREKINIRIKFVEDERPFSKKEIVLILK